MDKRLLVSGIILACITTVCLTGCASGAEQITPSNPLIIDGSSDSGAAPPPAVTPEPEPAYTPLPEAPEPEPEPESTPPPDISISIEFTDCEQVYDEFRDRWGYYIDAYYEITNTGEADILRCELFFTVYCEGGAEYEDSESFIGIDVGETISDYSFIDVDGGQVDRVEVTDWEIKTYDYVIVYKTEQDAIPSISCSTVEPSLYAEITIKHWQQDYYDYSEEWGYVEIYYEVENTGDVNIDYYKVYFIAECSGGKEYYDWDNGLDVGVGDKVTDNTMIDVGDREVRDVDIDDWDLTHY